MATTLINKHGRAVNVSDSRVKELLGKGFRHATESDFERAAERSAQLREVLTKASKRVEAEDEAPEASDAIVESVEEQSNTASDTPPKKPSVKEQIAELLQSGKKPDLEQALTAAGLKPEDYLTNDDRKAALQKFLGAEG